MKNSKYIIFVFVAISLLTGIITGVSRTGVFYSNSFPIPHHGVIMVNAFLGCLICLERAVVVKKTWAYLTSLLAGISIIPLYLNYLEVAYAFQLIASIGLVSMFLLFIKQHKDESLNIMALGAVFWFIGNATLLLNNHPLNALTHWINFLLFTILGERLELTKFLPQSKFKSYSFYAILSILIIASFSSFHGLGAYLLAIGFLLSSVWLLKFDIIKISLKKEGLTKFSAVSLLLGYVWLLFGSYFLTQMNKQGYYYDAALHSFFLGFVFSMIFAHGPIVFPVIFGLIKRPFHPVLYLWLFALHFSLSFRIIADIFSFDNMRQITAIGNGLSILGFLGTMATLIIRIYLETNAKKKTA